jgi:phosphotransferase system enzyme I (PtsP)
MIEVPSAVYLADRLAREVDFFALGTNDLIQYVLAADRNNPLVSKYYDPLHPAVLQILKDIGRCAQRNSIGLCICGEMATDPIHMTLLLGLGFREFSMAAPFIPRIKGFLGKINLADAQNIAEKALELEEGSLVREQIRRDLLTHGIKVS